MKAGDVMTVPVISVRPETSVEEVARLLAHRRISGVPVTTDTGELVGLISEGDLLRRAELHTEQRRSWWLELFATNATLAQEYVKSHGRKAEHVMTRPVISVVESTPLAEVANLLESRRIKRVPVLRSGKVVGIVSRANLVQALASAVGPTAAGAKPSERWDALRAIAGARAAGAAGETTDQAIREHILAELASQPWVGYQAKNVIVVEGVVHLWGYISSAEERAALRVVAENTPGVRAIEDHTIAPPVPAAS